MARVIQFGGGRVGEAIAKEILQRGHTLALVTRSGHAPAITDLRFRTMTGDATDAAMVEKLLGGQDIVVSTVGPAAGEDPGSLVRAAEALIAGTRKAKLRRLIVLGGAGSLETDAGPRLMDTPTFPAEWKPVAEAHAKALELFRPITDLDWTYVSPSAQLEPGARTGRFRQGKEILLTAADGKSWISIPDFALGFVDELGRGGHLRQRVTIGY